jgi:hypothetical protein
MRAWFALPLLALAGCSTPSQVELQHAMDLAEKEQAVAAAERALTEVDRNYAEDLASANAWDVHYWGIPASGWVAVGIVAVIALAVGLGFAVHWLKESMDARRRNNVTLEVERQRTEQARLEALKAEYDSVQRYVPPPLSQSEKAPRAD